jgi:hypothetical protein
VRIAGHSGVDLYRIMYTDFPEFTFPRTPVNRGKMKGRSTTLRPLWQQPYISAFFLTDPVYGTTSSSLRFLPLATLISFTLVKRCCMSAGSAVRCVLRSW